jgi:hypothetical protein
MQSTGPVAASAAHPADVPLPDGSSPVQAPGPEESILGSPSEWGRSAALAGRSVVKGVASIPDLVLAPVSALVNKGLDAAGVDPRHHQLTLNQVIDQGVGEAGLPTPANPTERVVDRIEQGLGGVVAGGGVGRILAGTENAAAKTIGAGLQENMLGQGLAATGGGTLSGAAHEAGGGPGLELAGALVGGLAPAGFGAVAQGTKSGAAALLGQADEATASLASRASGLGIPLKASQVTDSRFGKVLDSVARGVPFSGSAKFNATQQEAFNQAVGRTFGADAAKITPQVFADAKQRIGGEFDRLAESASLKLTPELAQKIRDVKASAQPFGQDAQSTIDGIVKDMVSRAQAGVLDGKAFQKLDSRLGKAIGAGGERSVYLSDLQDTLRDAVESSLPAADAQAWAKARAQYRDLKTVEDIVAKNGLTSGDIPPASLQGRVTSNRSGKASMARGDRGDLGDLSAIGQRFLKEPPNSFTADRQQAMGALRTLGGAALGGGAGSVFGPYIGATNALLGTAGVVGASRAAQRLVQNPDLLQAMLGNNPGIHSLTNGVKASTTPTLTQLLQEAQN